MFRLNNIIYLLSYTVFDTQTKYILNINPNYTTYSNTYDKNTISITYSVRYSIRYTE